MTLFFIPARDAAQRAWATLSQKTTTPEGTDCLILPGKAGKPKATVDGRSVPVATVAFVASGKQVDPWAIGILASCGLRECVNPAHLISATKDDSARLRARLGRNPHENRVGGRCTKGLHTIRSEADLIVTYRQNGQGVFETRECAHCAMVRNFGGSEFSEVYEPHRPAVSRYPERRLRAVQPPKPIPPRPAPSPAAPEHDIPVATPEMRAAWRAKRAEAKARAEMAERSLFEGMEG